LIDTSLNIDILSYSSEYYWRVRASNPNGTGAWSETRSFTTIPDIPASPALLLPGDEAKDQPISPELKWKSVSEAVNYKLQVSTNADFTSLIIDLSEISDTVYPVTGLTNGTTYYWRVSAINAGGTGDWSEEWEFTTSHLTGKYEHTTEEDLLLYPTPVSGVLKIKGIEGILTTVSIFTIDGKMIKCLKEIGISEINVEDVQTGIYIVKIINSEFMSTQRILKF